MLEEVVALIHTLAATHAAEISATTPRLSTARINSCREPRAHQMRSVVEMQWSRRIWVGVWGGGRWCKRAKGESSKRRSYQVGLIKQDLGQALVFCSSDDLVGNEDTSDPAPGHYLRLPAIRSRSVMARIARLQQEKHHGVVLLQSTGATSKLLVRRVCELAFDHLGGGGGLG